MTCTASKTTCLSMGTNEELEELDEEADKSLGPAVAPVAPAGVNSAMIQLIQLIQLINWYGCVTVLVVDCGAASAVLVLLVRFVVRLVVLWWYCGAIWYDLGGLECGV